MTGSIWADILILYLVIGFIHGAYLGSMAFGELVWEELLIAVLITVVCWPWIWYKWVQGFMKGWNEWSRNSRDRN